MLAWDLFWRLTTISTRGGSADTLQTAVAVMPKCCPSHALVITQTLDEKLRMTDLNRSGAMLRDVGAPVSTFVSSDSL